MLWGMNTSAHPIRVFRQAKKPRVSLGDLAKELRTTAATLSRIESGHQPVSETMLPKVVAVTGISARALRPDLAKLFDLDARRGKRRVRSSS